VDVAIARMPGTQEGYETPGKMDYELLQSHYGEPARHMFI
jgi:hypothetical protein